MFLTLTCVLKIDYLASIVFAVKFMYTVPD